jgi:Transposase DDE domain
MLQSLTTQDRQKNGRNPSPSGSVMDTESLKTTPTGSLKGYDGGKCVKGMKRFYLVDTDGRPLYFLAPANIHDTNIAIEALKGACSLYKTLKIAFADGGLRGNRLKENVPLEVRVLSCPMDENQFCVIEKRWVVERTIAWIQASRRLVKYYERRFVIFLVQNKSPFFIRRDKRNLYFSACVIR